MIQKRACFSQELASGTGGDDHLAGTSGDDALSGLGGDDSLEGIAAIPFAQVAPDSIVTSTDFVGYI